MKNIYLDYKIVNKIVDQIVNVTNPQKIILFGSYVDGNLNEDSDIDLLVVKSNIKSKIDEYTKIRKSLRGIKFPFDIIIITPQEYEFYSKNWKNSVVAVAETEGVVIYGE